MADELDFFVPEDPPRVGDKVDVEFIHRFTEWLMREHLRLSIALEQAPVRQVEFLNAAPEKPREGMIRGADGTNWNPGGGQGIYAYYGGAWVKL